MEIETAPILSEEQVIAIAQKALQQKTLLYDIDYGLRPLWRGLRTDVLGQEGMPITLWSVNYLTPAGTFDQESQFVEINDVTGMPLGIMTSHNYFFL
jgi:hypothetical protein